MSKAITAVFDPRQLAHRDVPYLSRGVSVASPETPQRAEALLSALARDGHQVILAPPDHGKRPIAAIHSAEYLHFLSTIYDRWRADPHASPMVIPNMHPRDRSLESYPAGMVGQAGYHMGDTACPIGPHTWDAALASANTAIHAALTVAEGHGPAYALCRPPGHHAYHDQAAGFCYLNNSAIAAQMLRDRLGGRVAILDVDVHHGNGTQGIFYARPDVLTVSIHADPSQYYPFFVGYAHERGQGDGLGANLNLPLPIGTGEAVYVDTLSYALDRIRHFAPVALVVALGLDAHEADPLKGMTLTTRSFQRIGTTIAALGLPTLLVQEGGYGTPALGGNLISFLNGFLHD